MLDKVVRHPGVDIVAINGYSEPSIDPFFIDRIRLIAEAGLKLNLNTNGTGLNKEKLNLIRRYNIINSLTFNLPSVDKNEFIAITGFRPFEVVMDNILTPLRA